MSLGGTYIYGGKQKGNEMLSGGCQGRTNIFHKNLKSFSDCQQCQMLQRSKELRIMKARKKIHEQLQMIDSRY